MSARDRAELTAQLTLLATPGLSGPRILHLLETFGTASEACIQLRHACKPDVVAAARSPQVRERVRRALGAVDDAGIHVLARGEPLYPEVLKERLAAFAPPFLFARGRLELLDGPSVAVVGCRRATEYGLDIAEQIGSGIARAGGCVVSGLARGIDSAAHAAALEADGTTVGVLGCGIDVYYPRDNMALQDRIAREGLLLSELLPGEPPRKHQFPHRNRIIAALSQAVIVVEAGERSGAVVTGNHAANQGVPVYGVPNAIHLPNMQGILRLFNDGAHVYTGLRDFLESTGLIQIGDDVPADLFDDAPPPDRVHARIWHALGAEPLHADVLAHAAGIRPTTALVALLELELDGRVSQLAGKRFMRRREKPRRV